MDSLTGTRKPISVFCPLQSYAKCEIVPSTRTKINPMIVVDFKILSEFIIFMFLVYVKKTVISPQIHYLISLKSGKDIDNH